MASSFQTGFLAGQRGYQQVLDNDRQRVLDERAAKEFARKEQEWSRADADRARVDEAFEAYNDLQGSGQAVTGNTSGFSDPSARMLYGQGGQQAVDDAASYANVESRRFGLPATHTTSSAPDAGGPPAPTVQMRKATELDRISALEKLAVARRDVGSMERLGGQRKVAEEDQLFASALKEYTGAEDQIGGTAAYLNTNSKRITMGAPDKDGFVQLSVVRPDGRAEFMNLTRQDQAKLYAAGRLMEVNPARAMELMGSVNKELAAAVAQENGLTGTLATNANSVADKRAGLDVQRFNAQTSRMNAETTAAYRRMLGDAAQQRAGAGGGKGADALWNLAERVAGEGKYGGNVERAYAGLKRGQATASVQEQADKLEMKLREQMAPEQEIQRQVAGLLTSRGLPPAPAVASLRAGMRVDGKPLTAQDYADWDRTYPGMTVEDILGGMPAPRPAMPANERAMAPREVKEAPRRAPITTLVTPRTGAEARGERPAPLTDQELAFRAMGFQLPNR